MDNNSEDHFPEDGYETGESARRWTAKQPKPPAKSGGLISAIGAGIRKINRSIVHSHIGVFELGKNMGPRFNALNYEDRCAVTFGLLSKMVVITGESSEALNNRRAELAEHWADSSMVSLLKADFYEAEEDKNNKQHAIAIEARDKCKFSVLSSGSSLPNKGSQRE